METRRTIGASIQEIAAALRTKNASFLLLRLPLEITFSKNIFKKSTQLGVDFYLKTVKLGV